MVPGGILGGVIDLTFNPFMKLFMNLLMLLSPGKVFGAPKLLIGFVSSFGRWLGIRF